MKASGRSVEGEMKRCEICKPEKKCEGPRFGLLPDDSLGHFDGTDGAHPAWWRGHDHTFAMLSQKLKDVMENPVRYLRTCVEEEVGWHGLMHQVAALALNERNMRTNLDAERRAVDRQEMEVKTLRREVLELKRALEIFAARERREGRA